MADGRDLPQRADEARAFLLDAENCRGDLLGDAVPHRQEGLAALALVLDLGIELGIARPGRSPSADGPCNRGGLSTPCREFRGSGLAPSGQLGAIPCVVRVEHAVRGRLVVERLELASDQICRSESRRWPTRASSLETSGRAVLADSARDLAVFGGFSRSIRPGRRYSSVFSMQFAVDEESAARLA